MASTSRHQSGIEMRNVFDELAPPATFSSPLQKTTYDVFINHHGPDVKHMLAKPIYKTLNTKHVRVFLDKEELHLGDFFPRALEEAIRSASIYVVLFSPGYAQSPWCLAELSFMLKFDKPIIPIFYRVEPVDLRCVAQGKGMYVNAFLQHQEKGYYSTDKLQEWKMALQKASFFTGEIINNDKYDEQMVLKNIQNHVLKKLQERKIVPLEIPLKEAKYPVGLEEAVADFEMTVYESARTESANTYPNVPIVGIWGMGGSGKTTLARKLFNQKHSSVERSSFIFDVKDKSKLHEKRVKLFQDLGFNYQQINNIEQGKKILAKLLRSVRVLIILDDVDHVDQLDALLPAKDSLGWGSLIIVTTQEREVLKCWGISCIYKMKTMNPCHAKQLFCWHAFSQPFPLLGFEELVEKFSSACNGLPLSLQVHGSELYDRSNKDSWECLLHQISKILPNKIKKKLRVTYDNLSEEEKQMFLDVACYLNGKDLMIAIVLWEESGWNARYGWMRLMDKCLVDLDDNNCIIMHDQLRDMGREIANTRSPYRLWSPEQVTRIQIQEEEIMQIRGMMVNAATNDIHNFPTLQLNTSIHLCGFRRTRGPFLVGLKFFVVRGNYQNNLHIAKISRELAWLSWTECAHRNLPSVQSLKNLRVLELHNSQKLLGLWKDGAEAPVQLEVLSICHCPKLRRIPKSIGYLYNLKKIVLVDCNHLRKIDILPTALEILKVKDCKSIRNINGIGDAVNLRELMLRDCPALDGLPRFDKLASLKVFELTGGNKVKEIEGLQQCTSLEKLVLHLGGAGT